MGAAASSRGTRASSSGLQHQQHEHQRLTAVGPHLGAQESPEVFPSPLSARPAPVAAATEAAGTGMDQEEAGAVPPRSPVDFAPSISISLAEGLVGPGETVEELYECFLLIDLDPDQGMAVPFPFIYCNCNLFLRLLPLLWPPLRYMR